MYLKKISSLILSLLIALPTNIVLAEESAGSLNVTPDTELVGTVLDTTSDPEEIIELEAVEIKTCCDDTTLNVTLLVKNGPGYALTGAPYTITNQMAYLNLTDEERAKFINTRNNYLSRATAVMHSTRLIYGVGSLVKGRITQTFRKIAQPFISGVRRIKSRFSDKANVAKPIEDLAVEIVNAEIAQAPEKKQSFRERVRQRSHEIVYNTLKKIDQNLWNQCKLVAHKNEISVTGSVAVVGINAIGERGGGRSYSLGINTGLNSDSNEFIFEFFTERDAVVTAYTPTLTVGIVPKFGATITSQNLEDITMSREGFSFYPPVAPGYATTLSNRASVGFNSSVVSFPPFVGDAFSYLNRTSHNTLVRFTFSLTRGPRLKLGSLRRNKSCEELLK